MNRDSNELIVLKAFDSVHKSGGQPKDAAKKVRCETSTFTEMKLEKAFSAYSSMIYSRERYHSFLENSDEMPFWQYVAVVDPSTTKPHLEMDKVVLRFDDPVWDKIMPPNHLGCRCRIRALNDEIIAERKFEVISGEKLNVEDIAASEWRFNPGKISFEEIQSITLSLIR